MSQFSPQTVFYTQRLPIANFVKPRILLNKSLSPTPNYCRTNRHYISPQIYQYSNQVNYEKKPIFYSPPQNIEPKMEIYQRNLSPQAMCVLDILNKIKNSHTFQTNKLKTLENKPKELIIEPKETQIINPPEAEIIEIKSSTFKRSCNCSPKSFSKNSPKSSPKLRNDLSSFPQKNLEESDIKIIKIELKTHSPTRNMKNSPSRGDSPKRSGFSPLNSQKFNENLFLNKSKNEFTQEINNITSQTIKAENKDISVESNKGFINSGRSSQHTSDIAKSEFLSALIPSKDKLISNLNSQEKIINEGEKNYVQNLLGKINQCLFKTSNILNNCDDLKQSSNNEKDLFDDKAKEIENFDKIEINDEKVIITTSPVKEFHHLEISDTITVEKQLNETLRSFNQNPNSLLYNNKNALDSIKKEEEALNNNDNSNIIDDQPKVHTANIIENNRIQPNKNIQSLKKAQSLVNTGKDDHIIEKTKSSNYISKLKDNFSPIVEKSEKDEDKENNIPFINIYTNSSNLSPKEQNDYINNEILKKKSRVNSNENLSPSQENPYNKEASGKIMDLIHTPSTSKEEIKEETFQINTNIHLFSQALKEDKLYKEIKNEEIDQIKERSENEVDKNEMNDLSVKIEKYEKYKRNEKKLEENKRNNKKGEKINEKIEKNEKMKKSALEIRKIKSDPQFKPSNLKTPLIKLEKDNTNYIIKGSYAKIAQKTLKNKEIAAKQSEIIQQITTLDQEIESLENEAQKERIGKKMNKLQDKYKAYRHKLPSIQENEESVRLKSQVLAQINDSKTVINKKPNISIQNTQIVDKRCNYLYNKGMETFEKKKIEIEENQKKKEIIEKTLCTFKPEFIAKKNNEAILISQKNLSKPTNKEVIKKQRNLPEETTIKRAVSQTNMHNSSKNGSDILKLNKSMSPQKNIKEKIKKNAHNDQMKTKKLGLGDNRAKPLISPKSTTTNNSKKFIKENAIIKNNQDNYFLKNNNPFLKTQPKIMDQIINEEILDILNIFSGINGVLTQNSTNNNEININKDNNTIHQVICAGNTEKEGLTKLRDISPIKPYQQIQETSRIDKSFNENSLQESSNKLAQNSFEKVMGLLDQKHQNLLLKSVEMTKKVGKIFKENSVYIS